MPLAIFALAGGFQDAYSYNCRGKVFANAQTGNIVLLSPKSGPGAMEDSASLSHSPRRFFPGRLYYGAGTLPFQGKWQNPLEADYSSDRIFFTDHHRFSPQSLNISANADVLACVTDWQLPKISWSSMCYYHVYRQHPSATEMLCRYHITKDKTLRRKSAHYYFIILVSP